MTTERLLRVQVDCALIHFRTALEIIKKSDAVTAPHVAEAIQTGINRLEEGWL